MNVHSKRWLVHSSRESPEGTALWEACNEMGLQQKMHEPTRGEHLLDLVLTDVPHAKACAVGAIADHKGVLMSFRLDVPKTFVPDRVMWAFNTADWDLMRDTFKSKNWSRLACMDPSSGAEYLANEIASAMRNCISQQKTMPSKKLASVAYGASGRCCARKAQRSRFGAGARSS